MEIEPKRQMVDPEVEVKRELSTGDDGAAKQPVEDSPETSQEAPGGDES